MTDQLHVQGSGEIKKKYGTEGQDYVSGEIQSYVVESIILRFIGWGLLAGFVRNPRLTEYGQKQYGMLMP
jgi:hypothetical protein